MIEDTTKRIKKELNELIKEGIDILLVETGQKEADSESLPTMMRYQDWYTRSLPVVRQLMPDRLTEFQEQYKLGKRKEIDFLTYTISDYLIQLRVTRGALKEEVVNPLQAFSMKFQHQIAILRSAQTRIDSLLTDIKGVLQADLFDNEISKARELLKKGHLRAAGVIAGVVLESHLAGVCENHLVRFRKRKPTISDYNDGLKNAEVYDTPTWRFIQRLGDIRNLCAHAGERLPTSEEVDELILGVDKVAKTIH
jgi:hypothetical protein